MRDDLTLEEYKIVFGFVLNKKIAHTVISFNADKRERSMTHKEFARRVGISETSLSRFINGERIPGLQIVVRMADVLDCSVDDLTRFDEATVDRAFKIRKKA